MYMEVVPCWVVTWLEGEARITRKLRVNEPELRGMVDTLLFNGIKRIELVLEERWPEPKTNVIPLSSFERLDDPETSKTG